MMLSSFCALMASNASTGKRDSRSTAPAKPAAIAATDWLRAWKSPSVVPEARTGVVEFSIAIFPRYLCNQPIDTVTTPITQKLGPHNRDLLNEGRNKLKRGKSPPEPNPVCLDVISSHRPLGPEPVLTAQQSRSRYPES